MANSFITFFVPLFYFVAQIAALRSMTGHWQTAAIVPVGVMSVSVGAYAIGIALNWMNPEALVVMAVPSSALYLAILWTSFLMLRPRLEA